MVAKKNILVTGSNGQLGKTIKELSHTSSHIFLFTKKKDLDITDFLSFEKYILNYKIDCIINCAAYTNVDKSESNRQLAEKINHISVDNIAKLCSKYSVQLIHVSTDYVFDGNKSSPYFENDFTKPINYYGYTKLRGENKILSYSLTNSAILRTSLLYSKFGENFVKRISEKIIKGKNFSMVDKLHSSPTNASDLSKVIFTMIDKLKNQRAEIFHFCNSGTCSRYELAHEINEILGRKSVIKPSKNITGVAKRPFYSVLNCNKLNNKFDLEQKDWKTSLKNHFKKNNIIVNEF
jgi:dTDP-4-dehydrorhamnose reductase